MGALVDELLVTKRFQSVIKVTTFTKTGGGPGVSQQINGIAGPCFGVYTISRGRSDAVC